MLLTCSARCLWFVVIRCRCSLVIVPCLLLVVVVSCVSFVDVCSCFLKKCLGVSALFVC